MTLLKITLMILVLLTLSALACNGSAPPADTESPTVAQSRVPALEPTRHTPVPTATIHSLEPTPTRAHTLPPPTMPGRVREYVAPTEPAVRMAPGTPVPTFAPPPTFAPSPTFAPPPSPLPPLPTLALPTIAPPKVVITFPTLEPPPLPTPVVITLPTPRPPAAPTPPLSAAVVTTEVAGFALECADIRNQDESAAEWTFEGWIEEAQATGVPEVLADWWSGYVDQFALQVVHDGPSEHSQRAADDTMWELYEMDPRLREYLLDTGCLTGVEVWRADATVEAWDRLMNGWGQGENVSIEEFADACSDIKLTTPTLDETVAIPYHMAYWWGQLTPPPELASYHVAVADFYEEWIETGGGIDPQTDVSFETQMVVLDSVQSLEEDIRETLLIRRCAGS